jgi:hypothetical protein
LHTNLGSNSVRANVHSNSVSRAATCNCGGLGGIGIDAFGSGNQTYNLVGNSVDRSGYVGIPIENGKTGGTTTVNLFNNAITNSANANIYISDTGSPPPLVLRAGHNDLFAPGEDDYWDGHSMGSGNLAVAPIYVAPGVGNLKLASTSPLIDAGVVCTVGGLSIRDAAGKARLHGASVDLGAFEFGGTAAVGQLFQGTQGSNIFDGTPGNDILCGLGGPDTLRGKAATTTSTAAMARTS